MYLLVRDFRLNPTVGTTPDEIPLGRVYAGLLNQLHSLGRNDFNSR